MTDHTTVAREAREAKRLYLEEGVSVKELAQMYGLTEPAVWARLHRAGVQRTRTIEAEKMRSRVVLLRLSGMKLDEIAQQVGRSVGCVHHHLSKYRAQISQQFDLDQKMAAD